MFQASTNNNNDNSVVVDDNRYNNSLAMATLYRCDDVADGYDIGDINNIANTICVQSVAEFNSSDLVLADQVFYSQIKQKYKASLETCQWNGMPTMERIYHKTPILRVFGQLNEIEYSSNAKFNNTVIYIQDDQKERVYSMVRYYFQNAKTLFVNTTNSRIQSKCRNPYTDVPVQCSICTRFDYDPMDSMRPRQVTAKLKIVKKKFNFIASTFNLNASIEVPIYTMNPARDTLQMYTNCRHVHYWYVYVNNALFRVAFRENLMLKHESSTFYNDRNYNLNIECEDETVEPLDFVIGYNLLFKYYKAQHMNAHGVIVPEWKDVATLNIPDLTDYQRRLLSTLKFPTINQIENNEAAMSSTSSSSSSSASLSMVQFGIYDFVGRLAISQYYNNFVNVKRASAAAPPQVLDDDDCFTEVSDDYETIDLDATDEPDEFFLEYHGNTCNKFNDASNLDKCENLKLLDGPTVSPRIVVSEF